MSKSGLTSLALISVALGGVSLFAPGCGSGTDTTSSFHRGSSSGASSGSGDTGGGDDTLGGSSSGTLGSGSGSGSSGGTPCVNLQCQQVSCSGGGHTTVSGTILDPAGKNPLYNVVVYVPNAPVQPFTDHASCDSCASLYSGSPLVAALTGPDGKFTLTDVPAGNNIPLVIQIGKWRRQITIPTVSQCVDNPLTDANQTRLPRNHSEGDIPKIAVSTGNADSMECLLERIGVDEAEYGGGASGAGRIHIYKGNGNSASGSTSSQSTLWDSAASLSNYDIVILSCEGGENAGTKPPASLQALHDYADAGGRVFASHFHYYWFEGNGAPTDFTNTAQWTPGSNSIGVAEGNDNDVTYATIDTGFPKGQAFKQWLTLTNSLTNDTLRIVDSRQNAYVAPGSTVSTEWIGEKVGGAPTTMYFTFNTPTTATPDKQCGRVVFSDLHVGAASGDYAASSTVPTGCAKADLSPQERALEFMLFDLSSCVQPDNQPPSAPPTPPPVK